MINTLEDLKSKFNFNSYYKTYESKLVKIKVKNYNLQNGTVEVIIRPKNSEGELINSESESGFIDYSRSIINYLTMERLFK